MNKNEVFIKLPDRPPPSSTVGIIAWAQKNLFSSTTNALTTILFFYLIYLYIPPFFDWAIFNANFSGSDRSICDANKAGACWTFIKVRFDQLLFGLYFASNPEQIWRPVVALSIFVLLLIPLVIEKTPHKKWLFNIFAYYLPNHFYNISLWGLFWHSHIQYNTVGWFSPHIRFSFCWNSSRFADRYYTRIR